MQASSPETKAFTPSEIMAGDPEVARRMGGTENLVAHQAEFARHIEALGLLAQYEQSRH